MSNTPMAQPMRALLGAMNALAKVNVGPTVESFMAKPHAERIANKNPGLMTRRVTAMIDTEDAHVEGRGGPIHARIYRRPDVAPAAPGYLFIHGGGFAVGGVEFCDHVCRELADRSGFVVVGLSYRLAPDHPFPAGIEDCQDVLTWMAKEAPGGLDPERIAIAGESAGGNFAALLALWSRDNNGPRLAHHAPIYPLTDFTMSHIDWSEGNAGNPGITPAVCDRRRQHVLHGQRPGKPAPEPHLRRSQGPAAGARRHVRVRPSAERGHRTRHVLPGCGRRREACPHGRHAPWLPAHDSADQAVLRDHGPHDRRGKAVPLIHPKIQPLLVR